MTDIETAQQLLDEIHELKKQLESSMKMLNILLDKIDNNLENKDEAK